jgi:uncharacterized protein (DUF1499 family)
MKIVVWIVLAPVILISLYFVFLSLTAKPPQAGLVNGRLRPCPATPNCVCSEDPNLPSGIMPLAFADAPAAAWNKLKNAVQAAGGKIQTERDGYLHVTFTSRLFRFVDDVEFRLISADGHIHMRSASQVGRSDFGVNRKRLERLRALFNGDSRT